MTESPIQGEPSEIPGKITRSEFERAEEELFAAGFFGADVVYDEHGQPVAKNRDMGSTPGDDARKEIEGDAAL